MKNIKVSLIDNDFAIQAKRDVAFNESQKNVLSEFFEQVQEELVTGQTAFLEIDGLLNKTVTLTIAESA